MTESNQLAIYNLYNKDLTKDLNSDNQETNLEQDLSRVGAGFELLTDGSWV